jgi:DNA repair exonuclease SbcCD ATPase subunit
MVNFKRFADFDVVLDPGLNFIVGPNESGKSTIVEGLATALFLDASSKSRAAKDLERWGGSGAMRLELDFEQAGRTYELVKDFGSGAAQVRDVAQGTTVAERKGVDAFIRRMVGFQTREAFESVAAVRQGELAILEEQGRRKELVPMIERKMTSSSGVVDAASILDRIGQEIARLRVGLDRPAKTAGPAKRLEDEREDLKRKIGALRSDWAGVVRSMGELACAREEFEKAELELARTDRAITTEERRLALSRVFERVRGELADREGAIGKVRKLRKDLDDAWSRLGATSHEQEKRAIVNSKADLDASERRVKSLTESAPGWSGEGAATRSAVLTAALGLGGLLLLIAMTARVAPVTVWLVVSDAAAVVGAAFLFRRTARIWAFARDLRLEQQDRQKRATVLTAALSKLGFPNYVEFEESLAAYDRARMDTERCNAILSELVGGADAKGYEEQLESDASALSRERREAETELAILGEAPPLSASELAKLRTDRDSLNERVAHLRGTITHHEWELGRAEAGDSLPDLEARLEEVEREYVGCERRAKVLSLAREGLESALASTKEEAASVVGPIVSRVLARVTVDRYAAVSVGRDLGVSVTNPDVGESMPRELRPEDLSGGTVDQLYLAIRFALLEFLTAKDGAPFILDDALVNADAARRGAALELLHELSEERQVLMLCCEEHGSEFADRIIRLPAS